MAGTENDRVIQRLTEAGKRITPERRLLLKIIGQNAHSDAIEIFELARRERPNIGLATVYRTLNLLKDLGVVRSSELGEAHRHFEVQQGDHVHLICSQCGRVIDVPAPNALRRTAGSLGFRVERTHLDLIGLCSECQSKGADRAENR